jgi:hypothetical protein
VLLLAAVTAALGAPARAEVPAPPFADPLLEQLVGKWKLTRQIHGSRAENVVTAQWVLQHQFLQLTMREVTGRPGYEALVLIGRGVDGYVVHWCDSFGGRLSALGQGKRSGSSIEFAFRYPSGPFYNTFTWNPRTKGWTFRMENVGKDARRVLFAVDTLRRP